MIAFLWGCFWLVVAVGLGAAGVQLGAKIQDERVRRRLPMHFKSELEHDRFLARVKAQMAVEQADASERPCTYCPQCWSDAEEDSFYVLDEPEGVPEFCPFHESELFLGLSAIYQSPVVTAPEHDLRRAS